MNFSESNAKIQTDPGSLALLLADVDPVAGVVLLHLHRLHLLLDRLHLCSLLEEELRNRLELLGDCSLPFEKELSRKRTNRDETNWWQNSTLSIKTPLSALNLVYHFFQAYRQNTH